MSVHLLQEGSGCDVIISFFPFGTRNLMDHGPLVPLIFFPDYFDDDDTPRDVKEEKREERR